MALISDREEYMFVTIPNEIRIDGGILPIRADDEETYGSIYDLRGEDMCFLIEAMLERYSAYLGNCQYCFPGGSDHFTMTTIIDHRQPREVTYYLNYLASRYIIMPQQPVVEFYAGSTTPTYTLPSIQGLNIANPIVSSTNNNFDEDSPLLLSPILTLYSDLAQYRTFYTQLAWAFDYEFSGTGGLSSRIYSHEASWLKSFNLGNNTTRPATSGYATFTAKPSGTSPTGKYQEAYDLLEDGMAYVVLLTTYSKSVNGTTEFDYKYYDFFLTQTTNRAEYPCSKDPSNLGWHIPLQTFTKMANRARALHNVTPLYYQDYTSYDLFNSSIYQSLDRIVPIFSLTDRTDVSAIVI